MRYSLVITTITLAAVSAASAQSGLSLMLKPWTTDTRAEASVDAYVFDSGNTDSPAADTIHLQIYDARGRAAVTENPDQLRFGFDMTYINLDTDDAMLPARLVDQSVSVGFGIAANEDWRLGAVVGAGYAGNNPFADGDALYGLADVILTRKLDESSSLQFVLDYNGNRTIFPDIPLPAVMYTHKVSDQLSYVVGVPYSSIHWMPVERLTIDVSYAIPFTVTGTIDYEFIDTWHVFAGYDSRVDAFTLDDDRDNRRLFFSQKSIEAGVCWQACPNARFLLAGGYAFDREFEYGFDVRDLDNVRDVSAEPYLRAAVSVSF